MGPPLCLAAMKKMLPEEESSGSDGESEIIKQLKDTLVVPRFYESDEVSQVMPGRKEFVSDKLVDVFTYTRGWS